MQPYIPDNSTHISQRFENFKLNNLYVNFGHQIVNWNTCTVKHVLNGPFIKRNSLLNRNIFKGRDYRSIP
jgi:hypothetical protein